MRFRLAGGLAPAVLTGLVALVVLTGLVAAGWSPLIDTDRAVSESLRRFGAAHPAWVITQRAITHAGDTAVLLIAGIALCVALLLFRRYRAAAIIFAGGAGTHLASTALKLTLSRHRPVGGFIGTGGWSYTSGHAVHSATAAALLVHLMWPALGRGGRRAAVAAAVVAVTLIGVSRVTLLAHWPSDVLGGWLVVLVLLPLIIYALRGNAEATGERPSLGEAACGNVSATDRVD